MEKDYSEILLQAVDIVVGQRLSEMKFDQTIKCRVVEVIDKEKGQYAVLHNETLRFVAYAEEGKNYRVDNWVYVLVPNGDYTQDKIIQGRYSSSEKEEPVAFVSPLENIEKICDIYNQDETLFLIANGKEEFIDITNLLYQSGNDLTQVKYICFSAEFKTLLDAYDMRDGDYGLKLIIYTSFGNVYQYVLSAKQDMFGNPYAYRTYQMQEQAYKISFEDNEEISGFNLTFYQDGNFKYYNGVNFEFQKLEPSDLEIKDISVQNIKIYFGIEATEQEEEKYEVLSLNTENIDINKNYMINGSLAKALLEFIQKNKEQKEEE